MASDPWGDLYYGTGGDYSGLFSDLGRPPELPPPPEPKKSAIDKMAEYLMTGVGAAGEALGAGKRVVDTAANYYSAKALESGGYGPGALDEFYRSQGPLTPTGELLKEAVIPEEEARKSYLATAGREALGFGTDIATDPLMAALGVASKIAAPGVKMAARGYVPTAAQTLAYNIGRGASAAFVPGMVQGAVEGYPQAVDSYVREGMTPTTFGKALNTGVSAGLAGLAAFHAARPLKATTRVIRPEDVMPPDPAAAAGFQTPPDRQIDTAIPMEWNGTSWAPVGSEAPPTSAIEMALARRRQTPDTGEAYGGIPKPTGPRGPMVPQAPIDAEFVAPPVPTPAGRTLEAPEARAAIPQAPEVGLARVERPAPIQAAPKVEDILAAAPEALPPTAPVVVGPPPAPPTPAPAVAPTAPAPLAAAPEPPAPVPAPTPALPGPTEPPVPVPEPPQLPPLPNQIPPTGMPPAVAGPIRPAVEVPEPPAVVPDLPNLAAPAGRPSPFAVPFRGYKPERPFVPAHDKLGEPVNVETPLEDYAAVQAVQAGQIPTVPDIRAYLAGRMSGGPQESIGGMGRAEVVDILRTLQKKDGNLDRLTAKQARTYQSMLAAIARDVEEQVARQQSSAEPERQAIQAEQALPPATFEARQGERRIATIPHDAERRGFGPDRREQINRGLQLPPDHPAGGEVLQAQMLAERDPLTGLWNKGAHIRDLAADQNPHTGHAMLDLSGFKEANDTLGHAVGDQLLEVMADSMLSVVERFPGVSIYRPGGDEFAIMAPNVEMAKAAARAVQDKFAADGLIATMRRDGKVLSTFPGVRVDYGYAEGRGEPGYVAADEQLNAYRARAEQRGERETRDQRIARRERERAGVAVPVQGEADRLAPEPAAGVPVEPRVEALPAPAPEPAPAEVAPAPAAPVEPAPVAPPPEPVAVAPAAPAPPAAPAAPADAQLLNRLHGAVLAERNPEGRPGDFQDAVGYMPRIRESMADVLPGRAFDDAILRLSKEGKIGIQAHPVPSQLTPEERSQMVFQSTADATAHLPDYLKAVAPKGMPPLDGRPWGNYFMAVSVRPEFRGTGSPAVPVAPAPPATPAPESRPNLSIKFARKPPVSALKALKAEGFHWNAPEKQWEAPWSEERQALVQTHAERKGVRVGGVAETDAEAEAAWRAHQERGLSSLAKQPTPPAPPTPAGAILDDAAVRDAYDKSLVGRDGLRSAPISTMWEHFKATHPDVTPAEFGQTLVKNFTTGVGALTPYDDPVRLPKTTRALIEEMGLFTGTGNTPAESLVPGKTTGQYLYYYTDLGKPREAPAGEGFKFGGFINNPEVAGQQPKPPVTPQVPNEPGAKYVLPTFATGGQRGLAGIAEDQAPPPEKPPTSQQTGMFGGQMLQGTERNVPEGREANGPLFTQEADARAKAEAEAQGNLDISAPQAQIEGEAPNADIRSEPGRQLAPVATAPEQPPDQPPREDQGAVAGAQPEGVPGTPEGGRAGAGNRERVPGHETGVQPAGGERDAVRRGVGDSSGELAEQAAAVRDVAESKPHEAVSETTDIAKAAGVPDPAAVAEAIVANVSRGHDHVITEDRLGAGGAKTKAEANLTAIELLRKIEAENRPATPDEQRQLADYVGWGSLPQLFTPQEREYYNADWRALRERLEEMLSPEELQRAKASTTNAHYTSVPVVRAMWEAVRQLGIRKHSRILEPAMGVGHFFGLQPEDMLPAKRTGVELDSLSGRISKLLYPRASVIVKGFEKTDLPRNHYDLAISNVPFAKVRMSDPAFSKHPEVLGSLHDYFVGKSLDLVRPGGVVAVISSRYTMDRRDPQMRRYLAERANLLGAIRLPSTAFKANAGTEVVTDIIFLRKLLPGEAPSGEAWQGTVPFKGKGKHGEEGESQINEYFARNPSMVLGKHEMTGSMYGPAEYTVTGEATPEALLRAVRSLPTDAVRAWSPEEGRPIVQLGPADTGVKPNAYVVKDGQIVVRKGEFYEPAQIPKGATDRVAGMIGVRDAARKVLDLQLRDGTDAEVQQAQKGLGKAYDSFVKKYGPLNDRTNTSAFEEDPDAPVLRALENWDPKTKTAKKSAIFSERTIQPYRAAEKADRADEALTISLRELGRIDWKRMEELTGKSAKELQGEVGSLAYENPEGGGWEASDAYLSGEVRKKLAVAEAAAETDPRFARNVEALRSVQPADWGPTDIHVRLGATWIPPSDISAFISHLLEIPDYGNYGRVGRPQVIHVPELGAWQVKSTGYEHTSLATDRWGTQDANAVHLIENALNMREPSVYRKVDDKQVLDPAATLAAREKQSVIQEEFKRWLWSDDARAKRLVRAYNDAFNGIQGRKFDGSHLQFPGMNKSVLRGKDLAPHQKNFVWRMIQANPKTNALANHAVGAGKTYALIAGAMERKRLGLSRKAAVAAPNHLVGQWHEAWSDLYPGSNVLAIEKKHMTPANRQRLMSRIATGNYDGVLLSWEALEKLPVRNETYTRFVNEQLAELTHAILSAQAQEGGGKKSSRIVKQLENAKAKLEQRLAEYLKVHDKDAAVTFEDLGVDTIMVDEAHGFKNLATPSKLQLAGIASGGSNRAMDLYMKSRYLNEHGGVVVFATATPVANTMGEAFVIQKFLQPEMLKERGLEHFDSWAANFGQVVGQVEMTATGQFKRKNRFAQFVNVSDLTTMLGESVDTRLPEHLNLPTPKIEGDKAIVHAVPATEALTAYVQSLADRAQAIRDKHVDPTQDNYLKLTTDGRKAATDMRLVDPAAEDNPNGKLAEAARTIAKIHKDTTDRKATQLVFLDLGTPKERDLKAEEKAAAEEESSDESTPEDETPNEQRQNLQLYDDLKKKLVAAGVPANQIAVVHEAKTDAQKGALQRAFNAGEKRILIGSTGKMGTGMNVQERMFALHLISPPWRPDQVKQAEGRLVRQGNMHYDLGIPVQIHRYVTEGSYDSVLWGILESKERFIHQYMTSEPGVRTMDDLGEAVVGYAEAKAIASGNPLVLDKVNVDSEVARLQSLKATHERTMYDQRFKAAGLRSDIERLDAIREAQHQVLDQYRVAKEKAGDTFSMVLGDKTYTDRKEAADALWKLRTVGKGKALGSFLGFPMELGVREYRGSQIPVVEFADMESDLSELTAGTIASIESKFRNLPAALKGTVTTLERRRKDLADLSADMGKPFPREEQLQKLLEKQKRINTELGVDKDLKDAEMATVAGGGDEGAPPETPAAAPGGKVFDGDAALNRIRERAQKRGRGRMGVGLGGASAEDVAGLRDAGIYGASVIEDLFRKHGRIPDYQTWGRQAAAALRRVMNTAGDVLRRVYQQAVDLFRGRQDEVRREAPREEAPAGETTARVPFVVTEATRGRLRDLGYTEPQIDRMTPGEAQATVSSGAAAGTPGGWRPTPSAGGAGAGRTTPAGGPAPTTAGAFTIPGETTGQRIARTFQDQLRRIQTYEEEVAKQGGTASPLMQTFGGVRSKIAWGQEAAENRYVKPLIKTLSSAGIDLSELNDYVSLLHKPTRDAIIAERSQGRNLSGSGWTDAEANSRWAELEQKFGPRDAQGKIPALEPSADYVRQMRDEQLRVDVKGGDLSQAQADALKAKWKDYVPLRTDEVADGVGGAAGSGMGMGGTGFEVRGKEYKEAHGRHTHADSPVAFMFAQLQRAIARAEKNKANQSFADFVQQNGLFEIDKEHQAPTLNAAGETVMRPDQIRTMQDYHYKVNGETHRIDIASVDPLLDRALRNMSAQDMHGFIGSVAKLTRRFSQMVTSWNPVFPFTNFARDIQAALANISAEHGTKMAGRVLKDVPGAMRDMWNFTRDPNATGPRMQRVREFREDGGAVGWAQAADAGDIARNMESELRSAGPGGVARAKRILYGAKSFVETANKAVENATRFAVYEALRDSGIPRAKAGHYARNVTLDFTKRGEAGPTLNALYAFFNANVQGVKRLAEVANSPRGRKIVAGMIAAGAALDMYNRAAAGDSDNDGTNDYAEVPEYIKNRNFVFFYGEGKRPITIPMPYGFNVFFSAGRNAAGMLSGDVKPAQAAMNTIGTAWNAFNPLGSEAGLVQTISPTVLDPFVQAATNESWSGRKIVPEQLPMEPQKPASELYFKNVSPAAKWLAERMNTWTGGDKVTPGFISVSPEIIAHYTDALNSYVTGGMGRTAWQLGEAGATLARGEVPELRQIPLARSFVYDVSPSVDSQRFKENVQELDALWMRYKTYRQTGETEKAQQLPIALLRAKRYVDAIERQIQALRRMGKAAGTDVEARVAEMYDRANRLVASARRATA